MISANEELSTLTAVPLVPSQNTLFVMSTEEELVTLIPDVALIKVSFRMLMPLAPLIVMIGPDPPPEIIALAVSAPVIETFLFNVSGSVV